MRSIFLKAIKSATKVRSNLGLNMFEPLNIYDLCNSQGVSVRIVDINMEGMYIKADNHNKPTILISNRRPLPRRVFTCAHEYGHHFFGHGSKIDNLDDKNSNLYSSEQDEEELLVNAFAGSLLMPIAGVQAEFFKRKLDPNTANQVEFYLISSLFGVGYNSLIYHCKVNKLISNTRAKQLLKYTPAKILKESFSNKIKPSYFKYFDRHNQPQVSDVEVSNYLIIPNEAIVDTLFFRSIEKTEQGTIYLVIKPGITEIKSEYFKEKIIIRIERKNYSGLSQYRHLV